MSLQLRFALFACVLVLPASSASAENWPGWRGPRGDGTSLEEHVPQHWNGETGENIAWKTRIPGVGHSSPIVWGDRVFVASCLEETQDRVLICLDRRDGAVLWQQTVLAAPLEKHHKLNSRASGTPVTDGKFVYVSFLEADFASDTDRTPGDMVVTALDFDGKPQWTVRPGRFASVHGFCSSPILFEDLVIVNGDHDGDSYIVALDSQTGETRWKVARKHKTRSYVTPIIREIDGRTQMVFSGSKSVVSLDPHDGHQHWEMDGPTEQFVASMVYNGKYLFLTAGFPDHYIQAIRPDGHGNVTASHLVWESRKNCSYVPSPVVLDQHLLVVSDEGIASCYDTDSGERLWGQRTAPHYSASLVAAGGLVYLTADDGTTKIVRPGPTYDLVAENPLGEFSYASPAISQGQIFLRGEQHLFCVGKERAGKSK